jgi:hypothetical protein
MDTVLQPREMVHNLGGILKPKYLGIRKKNQKYFDDKIKKIKRERLSGQRV